MKKQQQDRQKKVALFRALGDANRLCLVEYLLTVDEATTLELLDNMTEPISHPLKSHLKTLQEARLLVPCGNADEKFPKYRLTDKAMLAVLLDEVHEFMSKQEVVDESA